MKNKNILYLQGPMSFFFKEMIKYSSKYNNVFHITFNYADEFFTDKKFIIKYNLEKEKWDEFILKFIQEKKIDVIFLFGDERYFHKKTIELFKKTNIKIYVFEEGYIRPNYITIEEDGVNNNSCTFTKKPDFYKQFNQEKFDKSNNLFFNQQVYYQHMFSIFYSIILFLFYWKYPYYQHHKSLNPFIQAFFGIRSFIRKYIYKFTEYKARNIINKNKKYFFVPLQVYNDFQIIKHSKFNNIEEVIETIIKSYKKMNVKKYLVFKHHPMDRGVTNYKKFIINMIKKYDLDESKIIYIHECNLPEFLKNAEGIITVNSTVGISGLYHKKPVKILGKANYDINGITNKDIPLDKFWKYKRKAKQKMFNNFYNFVLNKTQINGSFYQKFNIKNVFDKIK